MATIRVPLDAPVETRTYVEPSDPPRLLYEGFIASLIGYAVLTAVLAAWSQWRVGSPFYIAGLIGANLFFDGAPAPGSAVDPAHVFAYNGAHLLIFAVFGFVMAALARATDHLAQGWYVFVSAMLFATPHIAVFAFSFGSAVREQLPVGLIAVATVFAFTAMAWWLLREHPALRGGSDELD